MSDLSTKVATVIDNGIFPDVALRLAREFKKVYYWSPWQSAFPSSSKLLPGDGFDEIERVKWKMRAIEKSDIVIYPDVYWNDEQEFLQKLGVPVWGSRRGEMLELNRVGAKHTIREADLPVGKYEVCKGVKSLRAYLSANENVWVKLSSNRGDMETFHSPRYDLIKPRIDEIEHRLGAKATIAEFLVEDSIDGEQTVEFGYDGYNIDGQWPVRSFFGVERKDEGFKGRVIEYAEFPEILKKPNEALSEYFKESQYRGFYSSELRVTDQNTAYLIDPCCRAASPPHEIYMEVFDNWGEIMWKGAHGEMAEPNTVYQYGCCAMIHCTWATKNWLPLRYPDAIRDFVKLRYHCRIDGIDYFVPQPDSDLPEIGAVIGLGRTMEEAEEHLKENAKQIEAYDLDIKVGCLEDADEEIEKAKQYGIKI